MIPQLPFRLDAAPVFLLRHGETEWNVERRLQGRKDSPLTRKGQGQARAVGLMLAELLAPFGDFDVAASPLGRTRQTAAIVCAALGRPVDVVAFDERLMEMSWGFYDGFTRAEIDAHDAGFLERRRAAHWDFVPPEGESYAMTAMRVAAWFGEQHLHRPLVVVTHGATQRILRGLYGRLPTSAILGEGEPQDAVFRLHRGNVDRIDCVVD